MKKIFIIVLSLISLAVIAGVALKPESTVKESTVQPATSVSNPNIINIQDFSFKSEKLVIKKGTKVTWMNKDDARHDITPTSGASDFTASKLLANGDSYEFTFNEVGTYTYKCSPHPYMKGTVEVTE